jgi:hypothetical protein
MGAYDVWSTRPPVGQLLVRAVFADAMSRGIETYNLRWENYRNGYAGCHSFLIGQSLLIRNA